MKSPDENKIDRQFREGLSNSEGKVTFREEDWVAMEELLDKKGLGKRGAIWLYLISGSIAAALLFFLAWPLFKTEVPAEQEIGRVDSLKKASEQDERNYGSSSAGLERKPERSSDSQLTALGKKRRRSVDAASAGYRPSSPEATMRSSEKAPDTPALARLPPALPGQEPKADTALILANQDRSGVDTAVSDNKGSAVRQLAADKAQPKTYVEEQEKTRRRWSPRLTLAILTAPDLNGVNSFAESRVGTNAGLAVSLQLTDKLSLATGFAYAVKPYFISTNGYNGGGYSYGSRQTDNVDATCNVLDVPLNINYRLFHSGKNTISAGTGLSSYFMLKERYRFNYSDNTSYTYRVRNENKHLLGVLNINATYQRQLNNKLNLLVQPYYKLPLTDIGNEGIDLRSVGVAFGVGWNFISPRKK